MAQTDSKLEKKKSEDKCILCCALRLWCGQGQPSTQLCTVQSNGVSFQGIPTAGISAAKLSSVLSSVAMALPQYSGVEIMEEIIPCLNPLCRKRKQTNKKKHIEIETLVMWVLSA